MRYVSVEQLKGDEVIAKNVVSGRNILMLIKGDTLTSKVIERLKESSVDGVYVEDMLSHGIMILPCLSEDMQAKIVKDLRTFNIDTLINEHGETVTKAAADFFEKDMRIITSYDEYTAAHCLSVAIYAAAVAWANEGFTKEQVRDITISALLHDIGKTQIPIEILNKPGRLTDDEFNIVKKHARLGYDMLMNRDDISNTIRAGILQHHEKEDGTGYPDGADESKICDIAKILHVCDVWDALTTRRPYKKAMSTTAAIRILQEEVISGKMSDYWYRRFTASIPVYRLGTVVTLNNKERGIVIKNTRGFALRPVVRILSTGDFVNLYEDANQWLEIVDDAVTE